MVRGIPEKNIYICTYTHTHIHTVARLQPAPVFRCVPYFTLYFSLVILEVLFTHPSKQGSSKHLLPLLKKENPPKRQIA